MKSEPFNGKIGFPQICLTVAGVNQLQVSFQCKKLLLLVILQHRHYVGVARVQPRAKKVEALLSYPTPVSRKQLKSFLSMAGYYRKFLSHYAHVAAALYDLFKSA